MKKKLLLISLLLSSILLIGCNKQILDTTWKFDKAIIVIGDNQIEVDIDSWSDYDDTTIQIKDKDGKVYLTDSKNILMIKE